jgi:DNA-binding NtrC family response regulator
MRWLCSHHWPGNVRELANCVERAIALTEHDTIVVDDVRDGSKAAPIDDEMDLAGAAGRHIPLAHIEVAYIKQVIAAVGGNMAHAARVLGIDRRTLYRKLGDRL